MSLVVPAYCYQERMQQFFISQRQIANILMF